ncbi:MAG: glycosyltransferase [Candidatus Omnitrophica bacterium]|nr:glycosyltransferase [Candidatus Omnitrophota bacterium]
MPKVLHLYKDVFPPTYGGIEIVLGKLAVCQARRGWDVSLAVSGPVDEEWGRTHQIKVIEVGEMGRLLSNPLSPGFLKVLREQDYDILHLHLPCPTVVLATLMAGKKQAPWVVSYQSDIVRQKITGAMYAPFQRRFFSQVSRIFVSSQNLLNTSRALKGFEDRCQIVPLGISPEEPGEQDRAEAEEVRARYQGKPIILFIGRFRWYKGLPVLIEGDEPYRCSAAGGWIGNSQPGTHSAQTGCRFALPGESPVSGKHSAPGAIVCRCRCLLSSFDTSCRSLWLCPAGGIQGRSSGGDN